MPDSTTEKKVVQYIALVPREDGGYSLLQSTDRDGLVTQLDGSSVEPDVVLAYKATPLSLKKSFSIAR